MITMTTKGNDWSYWKTAAILFSSTDLLKEEPNKSICYFVVFLFLPSTPRSYLNVRIKRKLRGSNIGIENKKEENM